MATSSVPFIDISRFESGFIEELLPRVEELIRKTQFVGGPHVAELEAELSRATGAVHSIGCANGTDAIQIALRAAGVKANDKVMLPDMTFWATFEAVVNVGASPITLDVERDSLHLSLRAVTEGIEKFRPRALILVHLYGWAAPETVAIRELCRREKIILIEDCAQAFGTQLHGTSLIAGAELATTSFYPAKVLGASGDAGAVFCRNADVAALCRQLINHGRSDHYAHASVGWNSRMGVYEAVFLKASLAQLPARIASRKKALNFYHETLKGLPLRTQRAAASIEENGYAAVAQIDVEKRDSLQKFLKSKGIGTGVIYPGAMSRQKGAEGFLAARVDHGNAAYIALSMLNLPCFAYIREDELEYVSKSVKEFCTSF